MSRRWLLAVVTVLVALGTTPRAGAAATGGSLRLADQTPWVSATAPFVAAIAVTGAGPFEVSVTLHQAVPNRSAFARTIEGRSLGRTVDHETTSLANLPRDAAGDQTVSVATPTRPGVYPVSIELRADDGEVVDRLFTHLVRVPDEASNGSLAVAWVQPLETADAMPTVAAAVPGRGPLTLDLTPAALADGQPSQLDALRQAVRDGDQLLATPYATVDASALVGAGLGDDLAVQRQVGDDQLFSALGVHGDPRTWVSVRPLTHAAVSRLHAIGVARLAVPEASLTRLSSSVNAGKTVTRPFAVASDGDEVVQAAALDAGLAAHFTRRGDQVLAAHQLLADLAVLFFDAPGTDRGVVVRPPFGWRPSSDFLDTVLPALRGNPTLVPVTLERFFDRVEPLTEDGETLVRAPVVERVRALPAARLIGAHRAVEELVDLLGPTSPQVGLARRELLQAEAVGLTGRERTAAIAEVQRTLGSIRGRLHMPNGRTFRLTARTGTIPVTVVNDNPFRVRVTVVLSSEKLEFTDVAGADRSRQVLSSITIGANANRTITVPVRTRASATFTLRATLLTPRGTELARSQVIIRSTVFSGVGVVLSIGAGLFLLLWWASHWRTVRRARRLVDPAQ